MSEDFDGFELNGRAKQQAGAERSAPLHELKTADVDNERRSPLPADQVSSSIREQQRRLRLTLERRNIRDRRVLEVIERTRRDLFVPDEVKDQAYHDEALPIGFGQTISQPYIVALMTENLRLSGNEHVLEIGTGSGYQTAVLAQLCRQVVTVERLKELSEQARRRLESLGLHNIKFVVGDGSLGVPEFAPYDAILVTAAAPKLPQQLVKQLKEGGRLVIPAGRRDQQLLLRLQKCNNRLVSKKLEYCRFVPLIGKEAWPE